MKWLVLIHVLSAIIGVGPTFFFHYLLRKNQTVSGMKHSFKTAMALTKLPTIGGLIAVATGIIMVALSDWQFLDFWIIGSLILYITLQVLFIILTGPLVKKLGMWAVETKGSDSEPLPAEQEDLVRLTNKRVMLTNGFALFIFIFMIMKPM
jgi:uncharacterized membrane protein